MEPRAPPRSSSWETVVVGRASQQTADLHRDKRPKTDSPDPLPPSSPPPIAPPALSQDLRAFFENLDPNELDYLPSSDPTASQQNNSRRLGRRGGESDSEDEDEDACARRRNVGRADAPGAADDSGVFLVTEDGILSLEEDDLELSGGDEVILGPGDEEIVLEGGAREGLSDAPEFEGGLSDGPGFEGAEVWEGDDEAFVDEAPEWVGAGRSWLDDLEEKRERERDNDPRWDALRERSKPDGPVSFSRAGGGEIILSDEALRRARALLEGDGDSDLPPVAGPSTFAYHPPRPSTSVTSLPRQTPPPPSTTTIPTTASWGFTSGSGAAVAGPSVAAMDLANARLDTPTLAPTGHPSAISTSSAFGGFRTASSAPVAGPSVAAMERANARLDGPPAASAAVPATTSTPSGFSGFRTAWGAPVAGPSVAAMERANARLDVPSPAPAPLPPTTTFSAGYVGFTSGSGVRIARPSAAAMDRANARLDAPAPAHPVPPAGTSSFGASIPRSRPSTVPRMAPASENRDVFGASPAAAKGKGRATFELGGTRLDLSSEADAHHAVDSPTSSRVLPGVFSSPSKVTAPVSATQSQRPHLGPRPRLGTTSMAAATQSSATPRKTPFKTIPAFRPPMLNSATPSSSASRRPSATPLKSAPALRRLNLDMTPRPRLPTVHKFTTPFKGGVRPPGLGPTGLPASAIKTVSAVKPIPASAKGKGREVPGPPTLPKGPRQSLVDAGFQPQMHFYEDLAKIGIPEEALAMDAMSAASFVFPYGRGEVEATAALEEAGCSLVTLRWVKNHWSLILWKLASLVRTRPDTLATYWHWQAAVDQLKYRYEREVNNAQRSCIKRIQEQDSAARHPMVLCVTQIRWGDAPDATVAPGEDPPLEILGLELTDGWYRIRSNVDATLRRACERGKIVVGCKLAISGAKIESSRDGTDVLDALERSSITIFGNSTSLAPWHVKLGWVPHPFVATLNSLTPDGGVAPLLDIIIERAFPCGYVDMSKGRQHETWNAEEERTKADEWTRGRAMAEAKLADELEKTRGDWDEIIELLQEAAMRTGPPPTSSPDPNSTEEEPDEILDRLEDATNKAAIINKLSPRQVADALQLAGENSVCDKYQAVSDLQQELVTSYPPRNVRAFRVLRVKDAQEGRKPSNRTAQITVWDADGFGADFFQDGQRYLVSNVLPKGTWKRSATVEVALATRRDSKWEKVQG